MNVACSDLLKKSSMPISHPFSASKSLKSVPRTSQTPSKKDQDKGCNIHHISPLQGFLQKAARHSVAAAAKNEKDLLSNIAEDLGDKEENEDAQSRGFGKQQPKPKPKRKSPEKPFQVQNSSEQPLSQADEWEANIVKTLAFLFILFFCEGIFLAIAGFLPEAADNFAINYVYPAFSPTLGVFLLISVIYGLLKTRQGGS